MRVPLLEGSQASVDQQNPHSSSLNNIQSLVTTLCVMCVALFASIAFIGQVRAADGEAEAGLVQWHSTNVQLLRGFDYKLGDDERTILTVEHANGWTYGDFMAFTDLTQSDDGRSTYYIESNLRFSLGKVTGEDFSFGPVKDVLISVALEKPKRQKFRWLGGLALDLDLPGFKFFKTNYFLRDNPQLDGETYQLTLVWNRPFDVGSAQFLFEGFADFAGSEGTSGSNQLIVPRLLLDVGALAGGAENRLWGGVEWQYWHNKFGVRGVTESVPQLQLKWVL